jgi:aspartate aminotransferase
LFYVGRSQTSGRFVLLTSRGMNVIEPVLRLARLTNEGAFEVLAAAKRLEAAGEHVVHLEIGQPDFPTPGHIVEAGVKALRAGHVKYAPPAGIPELRGAIAQYMLARGVRTTAENVVVTPGGKSALFSTMVALIHEDTDVLLPNIGFSAYEAITRFVGADPVFYELDSTRGFAVSVEALRAKVTRDTRVLVLNSPHNQLEAQFRRRISRTLRSLRRSGIS